MTNQSRRAAPAGPTALPLAVLLAACFTHKVESAPIEIKPIHITMDINLRVQRALDEFFDFDEPATTESKPASTAPPQEPRQEPQQQPKE